MSLSIEVSFRDLPASPSLRAAIEKRAQQLLRFAPELSDCAVIVQHSEQRHQQGNRFLVQAHVRMPGGEFHAGHTHGGNLAHEDAYLAVRDTFDALRRQLEDFVRIRRGEVKRDPTRNRVADHLIEQP